MVLVATRVDRNRLAVGADPTEETGDRAAVRAVNAAAFETLAEADLVGPPRPRPRRTPFMLATLARQAASRWRS